MTVVYPKSGFVSVWIGTFASEGEFNECVDGPVTKMLNLKVDLARICEVSFEVEPTSVRELIDGFSESQSFLEATVQNAMKRGLDKANSALVVYYTKCDGAPEIWDKMYFLGSIAF